MQCVSRFISPIWLYPTTDISLLHPSLPQSLVTTIRSVNHWTLFTNVQKPVQLWSLLCRAEGCCCAYPWQLRQPFWSNLVDVYWAPVMSKQFMPVDFFSPAASFGPAQLSLFAKRSRHRYSSLVFRISGFKSSRNLVWALCLLQILFRSGIFSLLRKPREIWCRELILDITIQANPWNTK